MREQGPGCFATDGFKGAPGNGAPLRDAALRWLRDGSEQRGARCELVGHGLRSTFIQVVFESPRCGIFLAKVSSHAFDDAPMLRRRMQGSFGLMRRLLDAIDQVQSWPDTRRLALVDDDQGGRIHWGWVERARAHWDDLSIDESGWIDALVSVQTLLRAEAAISR